MKTELIMTPRIRKSPYFDAALNAGATGFSVYNKTYLPFGYDTPENEFWAIVNDVTMWDVAAQRIVEITGADAFEFTNMLTPRNLGKCKVGQCRYVFITDQNGGILNDPVLLRLAENHFWLSRGDGDILMWAMGVAINSGLDVSICEPDVSPMQVQGPKSRGVMDALFGSQVSDLAYYTCTETELDGIPVVVSRTGFSAELGFEIYLRDGSRGTELWDKVAAAGEPFDIVPAGPSRIRRIEAGILDYGTDIDISVNPLELGMDRLLDLESPEDFIGKTALKNIAAVGVKRRFAGIEISGSPVAYNECSIPIYQGVKLVGKATSVIYSPRLDKSIGLAILGIPETEIGTVLQLDAPDGMREITVCGLPFYDPKREKSKK